MNLIWQIAGAILLAGVLALLGAFVLAIVITVIRVFIDMKFHK